MSDYAKHPGQVHHAVFASLAEAQADCIAIGEGCKGVTCAPSGECTVRNHDHLRISSDNEETLVKTSCPGGFVAGSLNDDGKGGTLWTADVVDTASLALGDAVVASEVTQNTGSTRSDGQKLSTESPDRQLPAEDDRSAGATRSRRTAAAAKNRGENALGSHGAHGVLPQARPGKTWQDRQAPRVFNSHREIL